MHATTCSENGADTDPPSLEQVTQKVKLSSFFITWPSMRRCLGKNIRPSGRSPVTDHANTGTSADSVRLTTAYIVTVSEVTGSPCSLLKVTRVGAATLTTSNVTVAAPTSVSC